MLQNDSQDPSPESESYRLHRRFDRMGRLVGDPAMRALQSSHVMIIGLGGVGSWAAESIVRSGVGRVTVIDFDQVCITNTNRQLHALSGRVGDFKSDVLAERFAKINPQARIEGIQKFYNAETSNEILGLGPDLVIDAIDNVTAKCHLIAACVERKIPIVTSTGSGGRLDPTQIRTGDLSVTEIDPLARAVRRIVRQQYGFPEKGEFGVTAIYSTEPATDPLDLEYDNGKGFKCVCPQGDNGLNTCDAKNLIMGNASFVTGAFGFACASSAIRALISSTRST